MPNAESIERSNVLTSKAQPFLQYKTDFFGSDQESLKKMFLDHYHVTEEVWNDWKWQLENRITNADQLNDIFNLSPSEYEEIKQVGKKFRFAITPYYLSLMKTFDKKDPIYLQSVPQDLELSTEGEFDPMNEINNNPAAAITRRYPDRVIINVTNCCAALCRHCQRKRNFGEHDTHISAAELQESFDYIRNHPEIRDVLVTGGDPFSLSDQAIENILREIRSIPTVEIIRIGTRTLATLPQRVTPELVDILKKYGPLYINTQINHPVEVTEECTRACTLLADAGIVLGNQMVFLNGVNTDYHTLQLLNHFLLKSKVRPYYIFHPKHIIGNGHFSISIADGIKIYSQLRGNTSGLAIPTYIVNAEGGQGKIALSREMLRLADEEGNLTLETWEGNEVTINIYQTDTDDGQA